MTSRELVLSTLEFRNKGRAPRQLWLLPWARDHHPDMCAKIAADFPDDISGVAAKYDVPSIEKGDPYTPGEYTDPWGCRFKNINPGIIGEVKDPLVASDDYDWDDVSNIHIPEEFLSFDVGQINEECAKSSAFIMSGYCPRPFEQIQFIRGSENFYIDLMDPPKKMLDFMEEMHDFYCRVLTKWAQTDVDALFFMDDWGSQNNLLIDPRIWCELFKPMYADYVQIAHSHGKKAFMHSDGNTLQMIPHLVDIGLDALNAQIFCIGLENLTQFKGKITFWGEIDRQHLLPYASLDEIESAVRKVHDTLWANGGCLAQCEFGPGAKPENVYKVFEAWGSM
ncbi:MAG: uroporphyrinogen decarboxylase family protein [Eubacteriales bacterium]|nr:uroporphyrinogen decarboxylase family protein [Eubacteriales bacterium]